MSFLLFSFLLFLVENVVAHSGVFSGLSLSFSDPIWRKPLTADDFRNTQKRIEAIFDHSFNGYMAHAFPADELKPLSGNGTNTLPELGNAPKDKTYQGIALTLIDALDSLLVFNRTEDFVLGVFWIKTHILDFNIDVRVHVFETNIRVLGGLLSAHAMCMDERIDPLQGDYDGFLLDLAVDLGRRLLPAFNTDNDIPYAWVNLRHGVVKGETTETCTAGIGTLLLEFGLLSYYTNDTIYYYLAHRAVLAVWKLRSPKNLLGNTLKGSHWKNKNAGIGAGVDSFYEYLIKAHILFGQQIHYDIFHDSYGAVLKYLNKDGWYYEANYKSGKAVHFHFNSLQAYWSGMQVLVGDVTAADRTFENFFSLWYKFGGLPERVLLNSGQAHQSERHYPLRPELIESAYFLYQATKDPKYLRMGLYMLNTIEKRTRATYGHAMIRNVVTGELEDYMPSYFLAETCKYLYLLFTPDHWLDHDKYMFTTEGHLLPYNAGHREFFSKVHKHYKPMHDASVQVCENEAILNRKPKKLRQILDEMFKPIIEEDKAVCAAPAPEPNRSTGDAQNAWRLPDGRNVDIEVAQGSFNLKIGEDEQLYIRQLGNEFTEVLNMQTDSSYYRVGYTGRRGQVLEFFLRTESITTNSAKCSLPKNYYISSAGAYFGKTAALLDGSQVFEGFLAERKEMIIAKPIRACEPSLIDVRGKLVLVERGACTFVQKALLLQQAGAAGMLVGNTVSTDVFTMGTDGSGKKVEIPSLMVTSNMFSSLRACVDVHAGFYRTSLLATKLQPAEEGFFIQGTEDKRTVTSMTNAKFTVQKEDSFYKLYLSD